jgi:hypothetical protein
MTEHGSIRRVRRRIEGEPVLSGLLEFKSELLALRPDAVEHRLDELELFGELLVELKSQGNLVPCSTKLGFQCVELVTVLRHQNDWRVTLSAGDIELALEGVDPGAEDLGLLVEPPVCGCDLSVQVLLAVDHGCVQPVALLCGLLLRDPQLLPPGRDELLALDLPEAKALFVLPGVFDAGGLVTCLEPFVQPPVVVQADPEFLRFGAGGSELRFGLIAFACDAVGTWRGVGFGARLLGQEGVFAMVADDPVAAVVRSDPEQTPAVAAGQ